MSYARLTLDNPIFKGTLRQPTSTVPYHSRPLSRTTMDDILMVRHQRVIASGAPGVLSPSAATHAVVRTKVSTPPHPVSQIASASTTPSGEPLRLHEVPVLGRSAVTANLKTPSLESPRGPRIKLHRKGRVKKPRYAPHVALYSAAILIVALGLAVNVRGMFANQQVDNQVKQLQQQAKVEGATTTASAGVPPTTDKPTPKAVRAYTVAPSLPKYVTIPSIDVYARVLSLSVDKNNELETPASIWDVGWYSSSAQPGQPGGMLLDGHSGIGSMHGIFHDLGKLKVGDKIVITKGDNSIVTYKVAEVKTVGVNQVQMADMLNTFDPSKPGLNLISCTGNQIPGTVSLDKRVLVRAVLAG